MNDRELAHAIGRGERDAIEALVQAHYGPVFRFLRCLTRHQQNAEDLTQQTFIKAQSRICTYRGESSLRTWLHSLAYREFTNFRRLRVWTGLVPSRAVRSEPGFSQVEEAEWLLGALHGLNSDLRDAFLLHEVQGLSVEEVAAVVNSPVGTVKSRLHHARRHLQGEWDATNDEVKNEHQYSS